MAIYAHDYKENGKLQRQGTLLREEEYNSNGRLSKETTYRNGDKEEAVWTYDADGNRQKCEVFNGRGALIRREHYQAGYLVKTLYYLDEIVTAIDEVSYTNEGQEIVKRDNRGLPTAGIVAYYDPDGSDYYQQYYQANQAPEWRHHFELNDEGWVLREAVEPISGGKQTVRIMHEYSKSGKQRLSTNYYDKQGKLVRREVNRYDPRGLIMETHVYNGQEQLKQMETYHYKFGWH
ncbi:MAG: hypothetical protein WBA12_14540 [Catalinimonas sp.]